MGAHSDGAGVMALRSVPIKATKVDLNLTVFDVGPEGFRGSCRRCGAVAAISKDDLNPTLLETTIRFALRNHALIRKGEGK